MQLAFLSHLEHIWTEPDEGIWEMSGEPVESGGLVDQDGAGAESGIHDAQNG
jgi:hypothetical protein